MPLRSIIHSNVVRSGCQLSRRVAPTVFAHVVKVRVRDYSGAWFEVESGKDYVSNPKAVHSVSIPVHILMGLQSEVVVY